MIELSFFDTPPGHFLELSGIVARCSLVCQFKMSVNYIMNILQNHCCTLLNAVGSCDIQFAAATLHNGFHFAERNHILYFIAPDVSETNRLTDSDACNYPFHSGVPHNSFNQSAGSRWRDNIIAHALHFHLRSREASIITPDFKGNRQNRSLLSILKSDK